MSPYFRPISRPTKVCSVRAARRKHSMAASWVATIGPQHGDIMGSDFGQPAQGRRVAHFNGRPRPSRRCQASQRNGACIGRPLAFGLVFVPLPVYDDQLFVACLRLRSSARPRSTRHNGAVAVPPCAVLAR